MIKKILKLKTKIKDWYVLTYPTDTLGEEINDDIDFVGLLTAMVMGSFAYDVLEVYDSLIRERIFWELSCILDVDYEEIYDLWLHHTVSDILLNKLTGE